MKKSKRKVCCEGAKWTAKGEHGKPGRSKGQHNATMKKGKC